MDELRRLNATFDSLGEPLGNPVPLRREGNRREASPQARRVDLVASVVLTAVQAVASGYLIFLNLFLPFPFDACGDPSSTCNTAVGYGAWFIVPVVAITVLVATLIRIFKNRAKSRLSWWVPLAGIGANVIVLLIATGLTNVAAGRPPL